MTHQPTKQQMQRVMQAQLEHKIQMLAKDTPPAVCECGCQVFGQGAQLRALTKFELGTPEDITVANQVWYCLKCYKVYQPPEGGIIQ